MRPAAEAPQRRSRVLFTDTAEQTDVMNASACRVSTPADTEHWLEIGAFAKLAIDLH
jgi:hypothetical protein